MDITHEFKLLTLVFDEALTKQIELEILGLGAKGYTVSSVQGKGHSGERADSWTGVNAKLETIAKEDVVLAILAHVRQKYFGKYPLIAYFHDVTVVRSDHFA